MAEEEAAAAAEVAEEEGESFSADQGVSVPVSPSDMLTMFFKVSPFPYFLAFFQPFSSPQF